MLFSRRKKQEVAVPEVGGRAPEFNLPSAQGGQLRLSMRIVRGPVAVVFFRGAWSEEDVGYFAKLSEKETEINHAGGSVVGVGAVEPGEARDFVRASGIKSYVLYDYQRITADQWGLLQTDKQHGRHARPAAFIVGPDGNVAHAWVDERPPPGEILAKVSAITGLPKPPEEAQEEKPKRRPKKAAEGTGADGAATDAAAGATAGASAVATENAGAATDEKPKKLSAEERERIKAERRAAREAGQSVKTTGQAGGEPSAPGDEAPAGGQPKKMSAEERERIKAERRAAREAGKSVKAGAGAPDPSAPEPKTAPADAPADTPEGAPAAETPAETPAGGPAEGQPKKMSAEERERIKAERRAAREAGKSVKTPPAGPPAGQPGQRPDGTAGATGPDEG